MAPLMTHYFGTEAAVGFTTVDHDRGIERVYVPRPAWVPPPGFPFHERKAKPIIAILGWVRL